MKVSVKKAVEKHLPILKRAIENYEKDHPQWRIEVLVSLIGWSLKSLRHYVEDSKESEITWEQPLVELHYPVDWNWKPRSDASTAPGGHIFGHITRKNTATKKIAVKTLSQIMVRQLTVTALADFTNWAWYEKLKDYYTPVFPVDLSVELNAIKSKRQRHAFFGELVRPFSIGATRLDASIMELKSGQRIPKEILDSDHPMDLPGIRFTGDVNGRPIDMGLVFEIHPLVADYDQRKAFHPVVVGLAVLNGNPRLVDGELVLDTPAAWSKSDRQQFWEELLREVDKLPTTLIPESEPEDSVILTVNSQLKVPASWWRPENRSETIKQLADLQSVAGELQGFSVQSAGFGAPQLTQPACEMCGWIHDAEFTQMKRDGANTIVLSGRLPDIVRVVHRALEKDFDRLSTKDEELLKVCGGYRHPCKAFGDLKRAADYQRLFDTSRHGFISLRGAVGRNRKESESNSE